MALLNGLIWVFLAPGDLIRRKLGITVEQDGGLIRSFINMCFWGSIVLIVVFRYE